VTLFRFYLFFCHFLNLLIPSFDFIAPNINNVLSDQFVLYKNGLYSKKAFIFEPYIYLKGGQLYFLTHFLTQDLIFYRLELLITLLKFITIKIYNYEKDTIFYSKFVNANRIYTKCKSTGI